MRQLISIVLIGILVTGCISRDRAVDTQATQSPAQVAPNVAPSRATTAEAPTLWPATHFAYVTIGPNEATTKVFYDGAWLDGYSIMLDGDDYAYFTSNTGARRIVFNGKDQGEADPNFGTVSISHGHIMFARKVGAKYHVFL